VVVAEGVIALETRRHGSRGKSGCSLTDRVPRS
jgi:hypothetical protein